MPVTAVFLQLVVMEMAVLPLVEQRAQVSFASPVATGAAERDRLWPYVEGMQEGVVLLPSPPSPFPFLYPCSSDFPSLAGFVCLLRTCFGFPPLLLRFRFFSAPLDSPARSHGILLLGYQKETSLRATLIGCRSIILGYPYGNR